MLGQRNVIVTGSRSGFWLVAATALVVRLSAPCYAAVMSKKMAHLQEKMRQYALTFPEAHEDHPWEHIAIKVRKKTFVFLGGHKESAGMFSMTVKLPVSSEMAATLPFVEPAGYGLGRSGWVTVRCAAKDKADPEMFREWIEQSYRAIAPKKLSKQLA